MLKSLKVFFDTEDLCRHDDSCDMCDFIARNRISISGDSYVGASDKYARNIKLECGEKTEYTHKEFHEITGVEYLPHMEFESANTLRRVIDQYPQFLRNEGAVASRSRWLGEYHGANIAKGCIANVVIRWVDDDIGLGVFAMENLKSHVFIGEYTGIVKSRGRVLFNINDYCFSYPSGFWHSKVYMIDSSDKGNYTRFINHSDSPNLEPAYAIYKDIVHIIFMAREFIPKGTQLTFNYGAAYWRRRKKSCN